MCTRRMRCLNLVPPHVEHRPHIKGARQRPSPNTRPFPEHPRPCNSASPHATTNSLRFSPSQATQISGRVLSISQNAASHCERPLPLPLRTRHSPLPPAGSSHSLTPPPPTSQQAACAQLLRTSTHGPLRLPSQSCQPASQAPEFCSIHVTAQLPGAYCPQGILFIIHPSSLDLPCSSNHAFLCCCFCSPHILHCSLLVIVPISTHQQASESSDEECAHPAARVHNSLSRFRLLQHTALRLQIALSTFFFFLPKAHTGVSWTPSFIHISLFLITFSLLPQPFYRLVLRFLFFQSGRHTHPNSSSYNHNNSKTTTKAVARSPARQLQSHSGA
ncbi:hypothetical protein GQ54DRAFT_153822 [Martensiomyces pterosporus]|nr:hypothetical protein GQ54DRAFT_153822 [Martensiomyces pterosporus]